MKIYINRETNLIENKKLSSIEYNIEDNLVYIFNSNKSKQRGIYNRR